MKDHYLKACVITLILCCGVSSVSYAKVLKQYFPNGRLQSVQIFYDTGGIKGPNKYYWANGRMRMKVWFKNGLPYLTHAWNQNGVRVR